MSSPTRKVPGGNPGPSNQIVAATASIESHRTAALEAIAIVDRLTGPGEIRPDVEDHLMARLSSTEVAS